MEDVEGWSVEVWAPGPLGWKSLGTESPFADHESAHGYADAVLALLASEYNVCGRASVRDRDGIEVEEIRTRRLHGNN